MRNTPPGIPHPDYPTLNPRNNVKNRGKGKKSGIEQQVFAGMQCVRREIACMEILTMKCTGQTFWQAKSREWKAAYSMVWL